MLKSGFYLTFFNVIAALLGLVRNVAVARLISVEDFGIASTFAMAMALIDMSANIGISRLIVQSKDGHSEEFQASLQAFQVARGFAGGLLILILAHPLANLFHTPQAAWAYQLMALMPVVKGFAHLDSNRFQRERKFMPFIITETSSQALATVLAIAFGYYLRDYRAMLFSLLSQQIMYWLMSQYFAERKYKLAWNKDQIGEAIRFGWPLLLNGFLMFGIFHGDRMIIGNSLGVSVLGWYSVAYMLTLMPAGLLTKVIDTMCLPLLSRHQDDPSRFMPLAKATIEAACLIGVLMALGFCLLGGPVLQALYGAKHANAISVLILLAVMQAIRNAKTGPSIVAISRKETTNPMLSHAIRFAFLPVAYLVVSKGYDVRAVVWVAIFGELVSLLLSFVLLVTKLEFDLTYLLRIILSTILVLVLPLTYDVLNPGKAFAIINWYGLIITLVTLVYVAQLKDLRSLAMSYVRK
jgi:O-antigen/teichoic acid export membrane protein